MVGVPGSSNSPLLKPVRIDLALLIKAVSSYRLEDVVERLTQESIPRYFAGRQPGATMLQSELLLAIMCAPGVRSARFVRLSRASDSGGIPPEQLDFEPGEIPSIGQLEIGLDTEVSRPPFG